MRPYLLILVMSGLFGWTAGAASPRKIVSVAGGINSGLVVAGSQVFWVSGVGVESADISTGVVTQLAPFVAGDDSDLAVGGGVLYWSDLQAGSISSVPVGGGTSRLLVSQLAGPGGLLVQGENLYWTNSGTAANNYADGSIMSVPLVGGAAVSIATQQSYPSGLTIVGQKCFWIQSQYNLQGQSTAAQIWSQSLTGPAKSVLIASAQSGSMGPLMSVGVNLYWVDGVSDIFTAPVSGGQPKLLTQASWAWGFVADDTDLYFLAQNQSGGCQIMKMPLLGGTTALVATCNLAEGLTIDANNVYWSNYDSSRTSTIYSLPKN